MRAFPILTLLLILPGLRASAQNSYTYALDASTVSGKLIQIPAASPDAPGGRPDRKVFALRLNHEITVHPSPSAQQDGLNTDTFQHIRVVQVFFPAATPAAAVRKWLGRSLKVTGTFNERVAPGQFTDVTLDVKRFYPESAQP